MTSLFIALAALLVVVIALIVIWPLLRKQPIDAADRFADEAAAQTQSLRDASVAIDRDVTAGTITADQADALRKELLLRLRAEAVPPSVATSGDSAPATAPSGAKSAAVASAVLMLLAAGLYAKFGTINGIGASLRSEAPAATQGGMSGEQIAAMVKRLDDRLNSAPPKAEDLQMWKMLGRSQLAMNDAAKSAQAYRTVIALEPNSAENEINLAEALLTMTDGKPTEESRKLLASAFARAPKDGKVLWLNAGAAQEDGRKTDALKFLKALQETVPPQSEQAQHVQRFIQELSK